MVGMDLHNLPPGLPDPGLRVTLRQRESVVQHLREAAADGRISFDELTTRLPVAMEAVTRADLYGVLGDLLVSEGGKVVLNAVEARALAPVIDVVVSGHVPKLLVVPPTWGVDVSALRKSMMSLAMSTVRSRPEVGHPRIVLRGQSSQVIRVRTPKPRDLRALRKRYELQDRAR